jgi:hypothetical protein
MLASNVVTQKLDKNTAKNLGKFVVNFFNGLANEVEKIRESTKKELFRYQQAISAGSAVGPSIKRRINILIKRLVTFASEFIPLLDTYDDVENETVRHLGELAVTTRDLFSAINRKYSGVYGEDLFKMTTESPAGLNKLGVP